MRRNIEFSADGVKLRGWFYKPDKGKGPYPTIVMAHGFSGVKEMSLDKFAEVFAKAGMAVLVSSATSCPSIPRISRGCCSSRWRRARLLLIGRVRFSFPG